MTYSTPIYFGGIWNNRSEIEIENSSPYLSRREEILRGSQGGLSPQFSKQGKAPQTPVRRSEVFVELDRGGGLISRGSNVSRDQACFNHN